MKVVFWILLVEWAYVVLFVPIGTGLVVVISVIFAAAYNRLYRERR